MKTEILTSGGRRCCTVSSPVDAIPDLLMVFDFPNSLAIWRKRSARMAIRWLHRKRATAARRLGRDPDHEELILEYKGLLKSKCTTSSYRVLNQSQHSAELDVTSDRVLLECEWLHDADTAGLYGFMMHVLDDENTVLTLIQGNTLDKEGCDRRFKKIQAILREGRRIYIAGMGDLSEPREKGKRSYFFPQRGVLSSNSRTLQFMAIANERGSCYDAYSGAEKPCPRDPFPTRK